MLSNGAALLDAYFDQPSGICPCPKLARGVLDIAEIAEDVAQPIASANPQPRSIGLGHVIMEADHKYITRSRPSPRIKPYTFPNAECEWIRATSAAFRHLDLCCTRSASKSGNCRNLWRLTRIQRSQNRRSLGLLNLFA